MSTNPMDNLDKTQLSNLAELVRHGIDHLNENILALKPHQQEAEGYAKADIEEAQDKVDLGNAIVEDICERMETAP